MGKWVPKRSKCFGACGLWAERRRRLVSMLLILAACRKTQVHSQGALFPELGVPGDTREARSFYWSCEETENQRETSHTSSVLSVFLLLCCWVDCVTCLLLLYCHWGRLQRTLSSTCLNCKSVFGFETVWFGLIVMFSLPEKKYYFFIFNLDILLICQRNKWTFY